MNNLTIDVAEVIVRQDPGYNSITMLMLKVAREANYNATQRVAIMDSLTSALACAYMEGWRHKNEARQ